MLVEAEERSKKKLQDTNITGEKVQKDKPIQSGREMDSKDWQRSKQKRRLWILKQDKWEPMTMPSYGGKK